MDRNKSVNFLTSIIKTALIFLAVALLCFYFGSFNRAYAANYNEAQSGITIHGNYDITTANEGAYAGKSVDPSLFSAGSYYTALYSGGTVDVTNGYMYEAAASGTTSTVRLFDEYSGTFSIFGQGFYDADSSPYDYNTLSFTFTNLANTNQYIKLVFTQNSTYNNLDFNAYYYDLDVQETAVYKTTSDMPLMASFSATSHYMTNKNKTALKFSYDNSTQALNLANSGSTKDHNLNTLLSTTLSEFSSYSVDMSFENKDEEHTAKFIIYELCGKLLDIGVHDNYDITTANDGAYASKSVDPSKFSATSYYTELYSGDRLDVTKGRLYMAGKKNTTSTIRLFDEHSGTFSIVGQGFYDADSSPYDYNRLSFQFTNTANTNQYIKLVFIQNASNYLEFNAYYYDKGIQDSAINRMSSNMALMASFTATSNYMTNKNKTALKFSYNNSTQALNLANSGSVRDHNLNDLLSATLPTFSSYSVDMLFEQKGQTNTAKFIAYELCGQVLIEPDTEKPKITVDGNYRQYYLKGETLEILPFTATDESGIKESGVRAEKGGQPVEISEGTLALNSLGEYTIIYYAFDNFDNENESEFTVNVTEITVAEKIILEGDGVAQSIPQLVTPSGWNYSFTMKDKSGNEVNLENGAYVFNEVQKYTVYYSVIPESETTAKFHYQTEIEITDTTKPVITLSGEYEKEYESNYELSIIGATVTDNCKNPQLTVEVLYDGLKVEISTDNKVKLDKAGKYVVKYTATDASGNSEVLSVELQVNETATDGGCSCNSNINSGNALLLTVVVLAFAVLLRKRIKKHN